MELQGGDETSETENTTSEVVSSENLVFRDAALSERITMGDLSGGDYDADDDAVAGLAGFLSRPVRIHNVVWPESSTLTSVISPWALYFANTQIKRKLENYARLRCKLHLKFVLNASPFYYGSVRACYFPLADERADYAGAADQVPFSQVPGVYLEPQNMTTAEMVLPFLYPNNWLDTTQLLDFTNMGTLSMIQYAELRSANGVVGAGINISVYAWAEEVELMGPTGTLTLQSGEEDGFVTGLELQGDEYEDASGTISGPATVVAGIAQRLSDVPVIAPFAMATSMGARAVAGIAKLFGYSNPPVIDDVMPYQPKSFHAFANTETRMPIDKLALDPKNEVTISSKVTGVDEPDPLAFSNLLTRESFVQGTLWTGSDPVDKLLWSGTVTPSYFAQTSNFLTFTPLGYFGQMFRFWRGSIVYKFRIIKTKYHKGRLIISWDPTGDNVTNADTETTTLTRIVDLEVEDEVEFVVPYKAVTPYLQNYDTDLGPHFSNGPTPVYNYSSTFMNGAITVRVQNTLTGPAAAPEIDILTYVRGGDDFNFTVPRDVNTYWTSGDPLGILQSGVDDGPVDGKPVKADSNLAAITVGESVASLRPLLHRTSLSLVQAFGGGASTTGLAFMGNRYFRFPFGCGRHPEGYTTTSAGDPYFYSTNHPIDWVLNAFVGVRGSTNMHFDVFQPSDETFTHLSAERHYHIVNNPSTFANARNGFYSVISSGSFAGLSAQAIAGGNQQRNTTTGQPGMSLTNMRTQAALSINVPQYTNGRFTLAFRTQRYKSVRNTATIEDNVIVRGIARTGVRTETDKPMIFTYYGAGVDFQPIFYLCTPRVFVRGNPTPST